MIHHSLSEGKIFACNIHLTSTIDVLFGVELLLALRNHDWLQNFIQFVLHQVRDITGTCVVVLEHVQIQLKLFRDGRRRLLQVSVLCPSLTVENGEKRHFCCIF